MLKRHCQTYHHINLQLKSWTMHGWAVLINMRMLKVQSETGESSKQNEVQAECQTWQQPIDFSFLWHSSMKVCKIQQICCTLTCLARLHPEITCSSGLLLNTQLTSHYCDLFIYLGSYLNQMVYTDHSVLEKSTGLTREYVRTPNHITKCPQLFVSSLIELVYWGRFIVYPLEYFASITINNSTVSSTWHWFVIS